MDDLHELLSEFERKIAKMREEGTLTTHAAQLFREFSTEVDRRTGRDRRSRSRDQPDRRKQR